MSAVFVIGAPRSGTTLLQSIISSHSNYFSIPETFFFTKIIMSLGVEYYDPEKELNENDIKVIEKEFYSVSSFSVDLQSKMHKRIFMKNAFELLIQEFNSEKKPNWVEKTPDHARAMFAIQRFYPTAKFIHIIRDPVDSIGSMMNLRPSSVRDFRMNYLSVCSRMSKLWEISISSALHYPYQNNVLHIYFEDLVLHPHENVKLVCRFLDIPFEENMLTSFHKSASRLFSVNYNPWQKSNLLNGLKVDSVHKWRKQLSPYMIWMIQRNVRQLAQFLGYYQMPTHAKSKAIKIIYILYDNIKWIIACSGVERVLREMIIFCVKKKQQSCSKELI